MVEQDVEPVADRHHGELRREALAMALYVAICMMAALVAIDDELEETHAIAIVWGTALGLALAHWFAFDLSARHAEAYRYGRRDNQLLGAQLAGAALVAAVTTIPIILLPQSAMYDIARLELSIFIGAIAFLGHRHSGRSVLRSLLFALWIVALAVAIATMKNILSGGGH